MERAQGQSEIGRRRGEGKGRGGSLEKRLSGQSTSSYKHKDQGSCPSNGQKQGRWQLPLGDRA